MHFAFVKKVYIIIGESLPSHWGMASLSVFLGWWCCSTEQLLNQRQEKPCRSSHWRKPSWWWIADLNLIMYFRMMYGTVGNCLWQMCTRRGIISNNEKCSYYVILKRIRTPIIGEMIIPISRINSDMKVCAKDIGRCTEAMMDSHECRNGLNLWEVAWCSVAGWEMYNSLRSSLLLVSWASARLVPNLSAFDQAETLIS